MRLALLLLFSLPAMAVPPCDTAEPKDVACRISHGASTDPDNDLVEYRWREAGLPADTWCGIRKTFPRYRPGRREANAWTWFNPYSFDGRCFPAAGESRTYCVAACDDKGLCANCTGSITVIGVAAADIRCCTPAGCGPC